jgi:hypothetical protein
MLRWCAARRRARARIPLAHLGCPPSAVARLSTVSARVRRACAGAFLWAYRDSLEVDGVMVQVPKAKLDKMQTELSSIKKLLGQ